ncbi:MAG TPA: non-ribosomal peptide synthetase, partial [Oceanospirillales bacterium]|nr:non-ribosomal peptide synthetase [Oceanospirillales bacterium]
LNELIQAQQITTIHFVPSMLRLMLANKNWSKCVSLRQLFCSGEALPVDLPALHYKLNKAVLYNLYGPTEAAIEVSFWQVPDKEHLSLIPIGKPIQNIQLLVLNKQRQLQPAGAAGELYIAGVGLARGYLNQQQLTQEYFINNDLFNIASDRLYRTGDLVRLLEDGNIEYLGRVDHQVKLRGFRIELGEIEYHLLNQPLLDASVVMVREEQPGQQQLVAYYSSKSAKDDNTINAELVEQLQQQLPAYMIPGVFVRLQELPLNANGKIDRKALPVPDVIAAKSAYTAPANATEKKLAAIWAQLLNRPVASISAKANFFELGGHSLLSIKLLAEIRHQFSVELSIRVVFETPQLAQLAKKINANNVVTRPKIQAQQRNSGGQLTSYAQQRIWFIDQMDGGSVHYNMPSVLNIDGDFKLDVAQQAFTEIINRHESLRTVFVDGDNGPLQLIQQQFSFKLKRIDLSKVKSEQKHQKIDNAMQKDLNKAFDLSKDLMLRATYLQLSAQEGLLLFNIHHIAADGWSLAILVNEFMQLYKSILTGKPSSLTPLPIQYADYAIWQQNWLTGEVLDQQLRYWHQQLQDLPEVHELALDFERPAYQSFNGAVHRFKLNTDTLNTLQDLATSNQASLFMLVHAAFSLLLSRYSNKDDIVIGTAVANRMQKELQPLIGFFVNTLVLRADCSGNPTFIEFLQQIKDVNLAAQENQETPFEQLVDHLNPVRSTRYNALLQIMLNMDTNESRE